MLCDFTYLRNLIVKYTEAESRMVIARGVENRKFMFNGYKVHIIQDNKY